MMIYVKIIVLIQTRQTHLNFGPGDAAVVAEVSQTQLAAVVFDYFGA